MIDSMEIHLYVLCSLVIYTPFGATINDPSFLKQNIGGHTIHTYFLKRLKSWIFGDMLHYTGVKFIKKYAKYAGLAWYLMSSYTRVYNLFFIKLV